MEILTVDILNHLTATIASMIGILTYRYLVCKHTSCYMINKGYYEDSSTISFIDWRSYFVYNVLMIIVVHIRIY